MISLLTLPSSGFEPIITILNASELNRMNNIAFYTLDVSKLLGPASPVLRSLLMSLEVLFRSIRYISLYAP